MALIALLTFGGGCWFFYDGKIGWPKKNVVAIAKEAFESGARGEKWGIYTGNLGSKYNDASIENADVIELIKTTHADGGKAQPWEEFYLSPKGKNSLKKAGEGVAKRAFQAGSALGAQWESYAIDNGLPVDKSSAETGDSSSVDAFEGMQSAFKAAAEGREWSVYGVVSSGQKGWGVKNPKYHSDAEIYAQIAIAICLWVTGVIVCFIMGVNSKRVLRANSTSLISEKGVVIPFASVFQIDTRKWDKKALAYISYRTESGAEKRTVIDDLKFAGADEILDRLTKRFTGNLVERRSSQAEMSVEGRAIDSELNSDSESRQK